VVAMAAYFMMRIDPRDNIVGYSGFQQKMVLIDHCFKRVLRGIVVSECWAQSGTKLEPRSQLVDAAFDLGVCRNF
jgi:hypothetical protein